MFLSNRTFLSAAFVSTLYPRVDQQVVSHQGVSADPSHPAFAQTHVRQYLRMSLIARTILHFHHL